MEPPPDSLPEELPREPGAAARFGERILKFFDYLTPEEAPIATRTEAVAGGFGAAVVRVLVGFGLPAVFIFWHLLYARVDQWQDVLDFRLYSQSSVTMIATMLIVAVCVFWSAILIFTDAENKWRTLNWLYFAMFAAPILGSRLSLFLLLVLAGHAWMHWALHEAARMRMEPGAEEERTAPVAEAPANPRPNLRSQYRGVQGFKDDGESGSG